MKSFGVVVADRRGNPRGGGPLLRTPLIGALIFACAVPAFGESVEPAEELRWLHDAVA